jgi:putative oligomerization/nucleic acid binding protein
MIMRRRRPLLRAAVVGGGAYMAGKSAANRSAERADQDARISDLEASQQAQATQVPEPRTGQAPGDSDVLGQLTKLVQMHDSGALTDEEFSAAKARLLG